MELDALGLISACSYALDCVEAELVHVTSEHAKRVAYMSVCVAEQMGIQGKELQDLAVCALLHDNALTQYIIDGFEELRDWAAFHHERLDGTGYPFGKNGCRPEHPGAHDGMCRYLSGFKLRAVLINRACPMKKACGNSKRYGRQELA